MKSCVATPEANELLLRGSLALAEVEQNGIRINTDYLDASIRETDEKITHLEQRLHKDELWTTWQSVFGSRATLGSRDQLGYILFEMMGFKTDARTATGKIKTDKEVLSKVDYPFVPVYLEWAGLLKIKDTYLEGIRRELVGDILRPSQNLHTAATYRSSQSNPNGQNLPSRDPGDAEIVRRCVIPRKNHHIVEVDFKQLEVMIAACYHHDPVMLDYLRDPQKDLHRDMAMELYLLEKDEVSKQARYSAKNGFVFPSFYGSVYFQCAPALWENVSKLNLKIAGTETSLRKHLRDKGFRKLGECNPKRTPQAGTYESHVQKVENAFWKNRFRVYDAWKRSWWEQYQREGGFRTLTGFYCRWGTGQLPKRNDVLNYPVQGSAFHCLLETLIVMQRWLRKNKMRSKIIGQIHDSLIGDVHKAELQDYLCKVHEIVTQHLPRKWNWICVPLSVEAEVAPLGESWWCKKEWTQQSGEWRLSA